VQDKINWVFLFQAINQIRRQRPQEPVGKPPGSDHRRQRGRKNIRDEFDSCGLTPSATATWLTLASRSTIANNLGPRLFNGDHVTLPGTSRLNTSCSPSPSAICQPGKHLTGARGWRRQVDRSGGRRDEAEARRPDQEAGVRDVTRVLQSKKSPLAA
jgi:hypothetical protein